jgi:hypothetical protein
VIETAALQRWDGPGRRARRLRPARWASLICRPVVAWPRLRTPAARASARRGSTPRAGGRRPDGKAIAKAKWDIFLIVFLLEKCPFLPLALNAWTGVGPPTHNRARDSSATGILARPWACPGRADGHPALAGLSSKPRRQHTQPQCCIDAGRQGGDIGAPAGWLTCRFGQQAPGWRASSSNPGVATHCACAGFHAHTASRPPAQNGYR